MILESRLGNVLLLRRRVYTGCGIILKNLKYISYKYQKVVIRRARKNNRCHVPSSSSKNEEAGHLEISFKKISLRLIQKATGKTTTAFPAIERISPLGLKFQTNALVLDFVSAGDVIM